MTHKLTFNFGVISETGNVRESNQDSALASENLLVVADGMGGHAGGDTASAITVNLMKQLSKNVGPKGIFKTRPNTKDVTLQISQIIGQIYLQMIDSIEKNPNLAGMGTTMTLVVRASDAIVTAHLGDSRAYLFRAGQLSQITHDHTFVQTLIDQGHISEEEGRNHPQKNVVMKVLGDFDLDIEPDLTFQQIQSGDRWFLCSDGIISGLHDSEIAHVLESVIDPKEAAKKLVDLALEAGSTDNVTAIVADVVQSSSNKENSLVLSGSVERPELYSDAEQLRLDQNEKEIETVLSKAVHEVKSGKTRVKNLFSRKLKSRTEDEVSIDGENAAEIANAAETAVANSESNENAKNAETQISQTQKRSETKRTRRAKNPNSSNKPDDQK